MPYNPLDAIAEILGERVQKGKDPAQCGYNCPFLGRQCTKRSTNILDAPYPVCSIWKKKGKKNKELVCVCPKRFYAVDFLKEVVDNCWPGEPPKNPQVAPEVKMKGFGNVDFVIADILDNKEIGQFLSVELQAIDITGSVRRAYDAILHNQDLEKKPTFGLNWDNVYKRYITQLIRKGYFHHHWGTKIIAVIQDHIYKNICERAEFMRSENVHDETVNIIFMAYRFEEDNNRPGEYRPVLSLVEGTSHANLQQAVLYKKAPSREMFCGQIKQSLSRHSEE